MEDSHFREQRQGEERQSDPVDVLATRALSLVAFRTQRDTGALALPYVDMLVEAAQSEDRAVLSELVAHMVSAGLRVEEIADQYVPEAARKLGAKWCDDHLGFVAVTVGSARLQALLRELGPEWRADRSASAAGHAVLVLVPAENAHTLGATVLTGHLRRRGISARLMVGARPEDVGPLLRQMAFDAVLISASLGESLVRVRKLVEAVRMAVTAAPPIVLGGTITTLDGVQAEDIRAQTGVDLVTDDPGEALARCGLTAVGVGTPRRGQKA